jgi:hypothetical protein
MEGVDPALVRFVETVGIPFAASRERDEQEAAIEQQAGAIPMELVPNGIVGHLPIERAIRGIARDLASDDVKTRDSLNSVHVPVAHEHPARLRIDYRRGLDADDVSVAILLGRGHQLWAALVIRVAFIPGIDRSEWRAEIAHPALSERWIRIEGIDFIVAGGDEYCRGIPIPKMNRMHEQGLREHRTVERGAGGRD